jgi:hypothetical protein
MPDVEVQGPRLKAGAIGFVDALREIGRTALSHAVKRAHAAGVDTQIELVDAKPAQALM